MDSVVIVLREDNPEGTRKAAAYMRSVLDGIRAQHFHLVVPYEVGAAVPSATQLWGQRSWTLHRGAPLEGVVAALEAEQGRPGLLHVFRSDVQVSPLWCEVTAHPSARERFPVLGPVGVQWEDGQRAQLPDEVDAADFGAACSAVAQRFGGHLTPVDYVGPEAFALHVPLVSELGGLDLELRDLGWALRDLCLRVRRSWRATMAVQGAYASILDPTRLHGYGADPEGRIRYYAKHGEHTQRHHILAATYTVDPTNRHQLNLLRLSVASVCGRVDVIHVALVGHPKGFTGGVGVNDLSKFQGRNFQAEDLREASEAFQDWLNLVVEQGCERARRGGDKVRTVAHVSVVEHWPNEQGLEQMVTQQTATLGCTWALQLREGEILESRITADELQRLMKHPDPLVFAYDVGVCTAWGSRDLIRIDQPYGDGGDLTGDAPETHDWRLHRTDGPRIPTEGGRVANVRLVATHAMDPEHRVPGLSGDAMTISEWVDDTSLALFLLAHSAENPDDVARWLDWTYGLATQPVVGWTEAWERPPLWAGVLAAFGAHLTYCTPDVVDFARWRNEAVEAVCEVYEPTWIVTVDPDEWYPDRQALLSWRRMVDTNTRHAYQFNFQNLTPSGVSSSSTTRLWRANLGLQYVGRVHETFDGALVGIRREFGPQAVYTAPHPARNRGTGDPETSAVKQALYQRLIREEVAENPDRAQPLILLSYGYANDGHHAEEMACLERALACASPTAYLPHYALAVAHARHAKVAMQQALRRIPPDHQHHAGATAMVGWLQGLPDPVEPEPGSEPEPLPWLEVEDAQICGGRERTEPGGPSPAAGGPPDPADS